jgi:S1-C subfamily serine protease
MSKKILKIIAFFIIGMVGGIFADQIFWPYIVEKPLFYEYRLEKSPVYVTERKEITIQENTALTQAIDKVEKTVIGIKTITKTGEILEGSGLIVTSDGLLITLAELIPKESQFSFFSEGKQFAYQILKRDLENNLALVKIEGTNLPSLGFADLGKLKLGERVFLVGALPLGDWTANEGIVKKIDTNLITTNISEEITLKGSPLFNISGEVLGINTLDSKGEITAIPVDIVKKFIGM